MWRGRWGNTSRPALGRGDAVGVDWCLRPTATQRDRPGYLFYLGWNSIASRCARTRGEPSSAHCEQRLSERLTPCPCDPVCACTGMRGHAGKGKDNPHPMSPIPHAAQRAVPGWRGGLGRVGADLASAGSMRPPPSPARHVSTTWLVTTHASRETARDHPSQPGNWACTRIASFSGNLRWMDKRRQLSFQENRGTCRIHEPR